VIGGALWAPFAGLSREEAGEASRINPFLQHVELDAVLRLALAPGSIYRHAPKANNQGLTDRGTLQPMQGKIYPRCAARAALD